MNTGCNDGIGSFSDAVQADEGFKNWSIGIMVRFHLSLGGEGGRDHVKSLEGDPQ